MTLTQEEIDKLIHMNQRLNLILGYAMGGIQRPPVENTEELLKYNWLVNAIENLLYLDKPLPPMP